MEDKVSWIRRMLENQADDDATDLLRNIKTDLASEEVYVLTPKGDVLTLPLGSTVIDVAYNIHSAVGNRMTGARVDGKIVPIDYKVKTGEIVEILTRKEGGNPNRDWLKIVKTSEARSKIRQWFKKEKREENIAEGKAELEREFKHAGIQLTEKEMAEFLSTVLRKQHFATNDDLFAAIGYGGVQLWKIMPRVKEEYAKRNAPVEENPQPVQKEAPPKRRVSSGVIVEGVDDMLIKFSKCCNPLPGDDIVGFITRGFGVSIHKRSCVNVPKNMEECEDPHRWVKAVWAGEVHESFQATLNLVASDRTGLLADVTIQLYNMHIFINNSESRTAKNGQAILRFSITVNGKEHLQMVIDKLMAINGVLSVARV